MTTYTQTDKLGVHTIRMLAVDAVQKANSGHPGLPMGAADMAYVLWTQFLKHNPRNPEWANRDRFVLSAGHGSMLLYALLHLTGYDLSMEEIQNFRQWDSRTPGHPEYGHTPGVETTTGPLGQGIGNAAGMALAERWLATRFNRPDFPIIDHFTYAIVGDGDLMEGISHEVASLAGHLALGKLIVLYDDNGISIDGSTSLTWSDDVEARFAAQKWHTQRVDGHDMAAIEKALSAARAETNRPSIILCKTHIGWGSPNRQDTAKAHGEPLGEEEIGLTREAIGWPQEAFHIPEEALARFRQAVDEGQTRQAEWDALFEAYAKAHPDLAAELQSALRGELPSGWQADIPTFTPENGNLATRASSGQVLNGIASRLPSLLGGSADLTGSNKTDLKGEKPLSGDDFSGRYIHFGIREHGMGAILNGMALHGGLIPYGGTFLVFSDYMRPSVRLAALMGLGVIYVFTHDSVGVGEDGPTHQPIEHFAALRVIPGLTVIRPADANETAAAWRVAIEQRSKPTALILTRQKLPLLTPTDNELAKGAYVLADAPGGTPDLTLIASGSEVALAVEAQKKLSEQGIGARVVSMPSWELFNAQAADYRTSVLPPGVPRLAVEAGVGHGWREYVGEHGAIVGINRYGASAPGPTVMAKLGLNVENVVEQARALLPEGAK